MPGHNTTLWEFIFFILSCLLILFHCEFVTQYNQTHECHCGWNIHPMIIDVACDLFTYFQLVCKNSHGYITHNYNIAFAIIVKATFGIINYISMKIKSKYDVPLRQMLHRCPIYTILSETVHASWPKFHEDQSPKVYDHMV